MDSMYILDKDGSQVTGDRLSAIMKISASTLKHQVDKAINRLLIEDCPTVYKWVVDMYAPAIILDLHDREATWDLEEDYLDDFAMLVASVNKNDNLEIRSQSLSKLPTCLLLFRNVTKLDISYTCFDGLPEWIAKMPSLHKITVNQDMKIGEKTRNALSDANISIFRS